MEGERHCGATTAAVILVVFWVLCWAAALLHSNQKGSAHSTQTPLFFLVKERCFLIGWGVDCDITTTPLHFIQSENTLHSLWKMQGVLWMAPVPSRLTPCGYRAATRQGMQRMVRLTVVVVATAVILCFYRDWPAKIYLHRYDLASYVFKQEWHMLLCTKMSSRLPLEAKHFCTFLANNDTITFRFHRFLFVFVLVYSFSTCFSLAQRFSVAVRSGSFSGQSRTFIWWEKTFFYSFNSMARSIILLKIKFLWSVRE